MLLLIGSWNNLKPLKHVETTGTGKDGADLSKEDEKEGSEVLTGFIRFQGRVFKFQIFIPA